jgi:hypothetical protein
MELIVGFIISLKVRVGFTINCLMLVMDLALGTFIGKLVTILSNILSRVKNIAKLISIYFSQGSIEIFIAL